MDNLSETQVLSQAIEVQRQTSEVKQELLGMYPSVTFETERVAKRPDQETLDLYSRLTIIGKLKPIDQKSQEELKVMKKQWEQDVKEKSRRTGRVSFSTMDLSNLYLSEMDLSGMDFGHATFENSNLSGVNFKNSVFMLTNLQGSILDKAILDGSLFISANLSNTSLRHTDMRGNFVYSDFTGATVEDPLVSSRGFFKAVNFPMPVEYPKANVKDWLDKELNKAGSKLPEEIEREKTILQQVDKLLASYKEYLKTKPEETNSEARALIDELVRLGKMRPTSEEDKRRLAELKLEWTFKKNEYGRTLVLDGMDLSNLDLSTIGLTNTSLIGADCEGTDFTWCVLSGINCSLANFRGAKLRMDTLRGCMPFGADFSGADMSAARLRDTTFIRANFRGAKLEYTDFKRCVLLGADFTNATVEDVIFDGSTNLENLTSARFI